MDKIICSFAQEILSLISACEKEPLNIIEEKISDGNLAEYIINKYFYELSCDFDIDKINSYFNNYTGCFCNKENRKFGLINNEDGLLLVIALILENLKN